MCNKNPRESVQVLKRTMLIKKNKTSLLDRKVYGMNHLLLKVLLNIVKTCFLFLTISYKITYVCTPKITLTTSVPLFVYLYRTPLQWFDTTVPSSAVPLH